MRERRGEPRVLTFKTGKIVSAPRRVDMDAAVLDISDSGACLLVSDINEVPDTLQLFLDCRSEAYACEVRWKSRHKVGVRFQ